MCHLLKVLHTTYDVKNSLGIFSRFSAVFIVDHNIIEYLCFYHVNNEKSCLDGFLNFLFSFI